MAKSPRLDWLLPERPPVASLPPEQQVWEALGLAPERTVAASPRPERGLPGLVAKQEWAEEQPGPERPMR